MYKDSLRILAEGGRVGEAHSLLNRKRSAVASVKTTNQGKISVSHRKCVVHRASYAPGCISPRVGVGFDLMASEADADRRRGVVAFGFGFEGSSTPGCPAVAFVVILLELRYLRAFASELGRDRSCAAPFLCQGKCNISVSEGRSRREM